MSDHEAFMQEALNLAQKGQGWTSPNPMVGSLAVKDGQIIGRGWHARFGGPHAEAGALSVAGEKARGATLYVTLEPCKHHGKTPPCADAVLRAGISTVVLGALDPNPHAAGGLEKLRSKGVKVITGVRDEECRMLNAPFFKRMRTGLPLVSVKWAMSLDGKIAAAGGDSKWITSPQARIFARGLRGNHDAVLVGIGTVLADHPSLSVRAAAPDEPQALWQPKRVVLDARARMPLDDPMWEAADAGRMILAVADDAPGERVEALRQKGAIVFNVPAQAGRLSLERVLRGLVELGILSVFVEGGSEALGGFLDARAADRVYAMIAPKIIGGRDAISAVRGEGVKRVCDAQALRDVRFHAIGSDLLIEGKLGAWEWLAAARADG